MNIDSLIVFVYGVKIWNHIEIISIFLNLLKNVRIKASKNKSGKPCQKRRNEWGLFERIMECVVH